MSSSRNKPRGVTPIVSYVSSFVGVVQQPLLEYTVTEAKSMKSMKLEKIDEKMTALFFKRLCNEARIRHLPSMISCWEWNVHTVCRETQDRIVIFTVVHG